MRGLPAEEVVKQADAYLGQVMRRPSTYGPRTSNSLAFGALEALTGQTVTSPDNWGQKSRLPEPPARRPMYDGPVF